MLLMTDSYDGLVGFAFSDGTFDPFNSDNPAGLFVNGGQLTLSGPNQTPISGILTTGVEVVTDDIPLHIHNADNTATVDITFSGSEVDFAVTGASGHFEVNTVSQSVICRTMNFMCPTNPFSFHFLSDVTNTDVSVIVIDDATSGAGDDNDWAFGVDGHIYFKTGGIWVLKI
jgi:hypothetical protein